MFIEGHVSDKEQAIKLYEAYGIPYQVLKKSGEVKAKSSTSARCYDFQEHNIRGRTLVSCQS